MDNQYLIGRLTVHFGNDAVSLVHRVNGRLSSMDLADGDQIEIENGNGHTVITVNDVLETIVARRSKKHTTWNFGQSFYEGAKVRIKLDKDATKRVETNAKKQLIAQLFEEAKHGLYTYEEVQEILINWESEDEISVYERSNSNE